MSSSGSRHARSGRGRAGKRLETLEAQRVDLARQISEARAQAKVEEAERRAAMERVAGRVALAAADSDPAWRRGLLALLDRELESGRERKMFDLAERREPDEPREQSALALVDEGAEAA